MTHGQSLTPAPSVLHREGEEGAELDGIVLDDAGSSHRCVRWLLLSMHGVHNTTGMLKPVLALFGSGDARDAVAGPLMLHNAVAAFSKADVKGMGMLEPGVLFMTAHGQAGHAHAANKVLDVSICDPQHEMFDEEQCRARFSGAHVYLAQSE